MSTEDGKYVSKTETGKVFLVGAGPGDPDLLTVKALRLLQEADVVVYDRLVSDEVLALVPAGVSRIFVGKSPGNHPASQASVNETLVRLARKGHRVVRLKGGDPFVFGRGGEEAQHLVRNRIRFEVVPGVTAALACAAYAGIPLTHRGLAHSLRFVAGHCRDDMPLDLDWNGLADPDTTLVFYMALMNLAEIRSRLIDAGLPGSTPAAIVESGTTQRQRTIPTTLDELVRAARSRRVATPAIVVVGRVAELAAELAWFEAATRDERVPSQGGVSSYA